ncbi:MAG: hypothetical protein DRR08_23580 [Candidatus Parabeggiatoa sp. nov. 2]|nr:MAG: hypothetical protein DRR08_23580 [Gammaproteobacteria bacterium]
MALPITNYQLLITIYQLPISTAIWLASEVVKIMKRSILCLRCAFVKSWALREEYQVPSEQRDET